MEPVVKKFDNNIYQIDVLMEGKEGRLACYYIDTKDPILIAVSYTHLTLPTNREV